MGVSKVGVGGRVEGGRRWAYRRRTRPHIEVEPAAHERNASADLQRPSGGSNVQWALRSEGCRRLNINDRWGVCRAAIPFLARRGMSCHVHPRRAYVWSHSWRRACGPRRARTDAGERTEQGGRAGEGDAQLRFPPDEARAYSLSDIRYSLFDVLRSSFFVRRSLFVVCPPLAHQY